MIIMLIISNEMNSIPFQTKENKSNVTKETWPTARRHNTHKH